MCILTAMVDIQQQMMCKYVVFFFTKPGLTDVGRFKMMNKGRPSCHIRQSANGNNVNDLQMQDEIAKQLT